MQIAKRIFLFLAVNILVLVTISFTAQIVMSLLGVSPYAGYGGRGYYGFDLTGLLIWCGVIGFTGSFISLALSRWMAKMMMGVQVIDPQTASGDERALVGLVHRLAQKAGLPAMPEVGVYASPEVNAFATGPSKSRALVAVSSGLLQSMDDSAIEGVLGHEIAHVANGDMVTMTLIQGVVNTFVMFFARIAAFAVANAMSGDRDRDERPNPWIIHLCVFVFEIFFSLLGSIVVCYFSRRREFRADAGGSRFAGREKMVHALETLKRTYEPYDNKPALATLKIAGQPRGLAVLFATHPDLDTRIARLRSGGAA